MQLALHIIMVFGLGGGIAKQNGRNFNGKQRAVMAATMARCQVGSPRGQDPDTDQTRGRGLSAQYRCWHSNKAQRTAANVLCLRHRKEIA